MPCSCTGAKCSTITQVINAQFKAGADVNSDVLFLPNDTIEIVVDTTLTNGTKVTKSGSVITIGIPAPLNLVPTPITTTPTATGNTTNLNSFVIDPAGNLWFIDKDGEASIIEIANNSDKVLYTTTNVTPTSTPINGVDTLVNPDGTRFEWDGLTWHQLQLPQNLTVADISNIESGPSTISNTNLITVKNGLNVRNGVTGEAIIQDGGTLEEDTFTESNNFRRIWNNNNSSSTINPYQFLGTSPTPASNSTGGLVNITQSQDGSGLVGFTNRGIGTGNFAQLRSANALYNGSLLNLTYLGTTNALVVNNQGSGSSNAAIQAGSTNTASSTIFVNGQQTGTGVVKITHLGTGADANASGMSIDITGSGTLAQGLFIESTTSGGTGGNLLELRNSGTGPLNKIMSVQSNGQVSISTGSNSAFLDAQLQVDSTTRGFLPPRMTSVQKNAITLPHAGLMLYDITLNRPCFYNGSIWVTL